MILYMYNRSNLYYFIVINQSQCARDKQLALCRYGHPTRVTYKHNKSVELVKNWFQYALQWLTIVTSGTFLFGHYNNYSHTY